MEATQELAQDPGPQVSDPEDDPHRTLNCKDCWTEPLTGGEAALGDRRRHASLPRVDHLTPPEAVSTQAVVAPWIRRALLAEPAVQEWRRAYGNRFRHRSGGLPRTARELRRTIEAEFSGEGGAEQVAEVGRAARQAHSEQAVSYRSKAVIKRELANGVRVVAAASELVARSPVVLLTFPGNDHVATLTVLRDGPLGALALLADRLADRYLVPASEVVFCVVTGQAPRLSPLRLGMRFRKFIVDGIPITAASRLVLDVDPQVHPAALAHAFAQWQQTLAIRPAPISPILDSLADELVGRLTLAAADKRARSRTHPSELIKIGRRSWWIVPTIPWTRLAHEIRCDPHLVRGRAAAVIQLLVPLDEPRVPRWSARHTVPR